jgi:hypothetical protein
MEQNLLKISKVVKNNMKQIKRNRTMEELMEEMTALMEEIEQGNKDFHDRCVEHNCQCCVGE